MISLLVSILLVVLMIMFACWIISLLPIPQPFKNIVIAIVALIIVLSYFGAGGNDHFRAYWR